MTIARCLHVHPLFMAQAFGVLSQISPCELGYRERCPTEMGSEYSVEQSAIFRRTLIHLLLIGVRAILQYMMMPRRVINPAHIVATIISTTKKEKHRVALFRDAITDGM